MNERTKNFLREKFKEYYLKYPIQLPPGFESREWGFVMFDALPKIVMYRHKSFFSRQEVLEYLRSMAPAHAFFSVAYYEHPEAGTMADKHWTGADLIFDLDADHLRDAPESYPAMLANVKDETLKLLGFLTDDFGFSEDLIDVVFSGGRGYHIHVRDQRVRTLGSAERRDIVDYLSGNGLDIVSMFDRSKSSGMDVYREYGTKTIQRPQYQIGQFHDVHREQGTKSKTSSIQIVGHESGWRKRVKEGVIEYLDEQSSKPDKEALKNIQKLEGVGKRTAMDILMLARNKRIINKFNETGSIDLTWQPRFFESLAKSSIERFRVHGAESDEPVTGDIKRLIRLPTSLHGGSSLRVVPLTLETIKVFDPLKDAVVFSDKAIAVAAESPASCDLRGNHFEIEEGGNKVPEYAGIYLMCRGAVEYAGRV